MLFETILRFRTDLAQLLYTHLDLIMADKRSYERRTRDLCEDLGLRGTEYGRVYERKRALSKAIAELRGVTLTSGVITAIQIERTRDGSDYKLTVKKGNHGTMAPEEMPLSVDAKAPAPVGDASLAHDIVRHFHKVFHGASIGQPQSKEIAQATTLVAQHGFGCAKYIVDYAHTAAAETKYRPQTFGGISNMRLGRPAPMTKFAAGSRLRPSFRPTPKRGAISRRSLLRLHRNGTPRRKRGCGPCRRKNSRTSARECKLNW